MPKIATVIPSFQGVDRLRYTLDSWRKHDPESWGRHPILIVEDSSPNDRDGWHEKYSDVGKQFLLPVTCTPTWGGLQGAAQFAFGTAMLMYNPDFIMYMGDDLAFTPGAITNLFDFVEQNDLSRIGCVQVPYWNSHEVEIDGDLVFPGDQKYTKFFRDHEWPLTIPRSAHYDNNGVCRDYARPNGCGFLVRTALLKDTGGVGGASHRIDEKIGLNCWTKSEYGCVTVPGPPWIHWFAGASSRLSQMPRHSAASEAAWVFDTGLSVVAADRAVRECMREWEDKIENRDAMMNLTVPDPSPYCPTTEDRAYWQSDSCDAREKGLTVEQVRQSHLAYWEKMNAA